MQGALRAKNAAFFEKHYASAWAKLGDVTEPQSALVLEDGVPIDIDLGGGVRLYRGNGLQQAHAQVAGYMKDPDRIRFANVHHCNLSSISIRHLRTLIEGWERSEGRHFERFPVVDSGYLFIFGVGLGYHIEPLLEQTGCHNLVIIEPTLELMHHSTFAIDWQRIYERLRRRSGRLTFAFEAEPEAIVHVCDVSVQRGDSFFLDGSYFYPHYLTKLFDRAYDLLRLRLKVTGLSSGFFEDEVKMMTNTARNFAQWDVKVIDPRFLMREAVPTFIVGSGPSLDDAMPYLRKWRDHGIVVSCGTTLKILLEAGIRPDIHCEIENGPTVHDLLEQLDQGFGLSDIRLLASTTVDSRIPGFFDRRWLFLRGGPSPARLFSAALKPLPGAAPNVVNVAVSAAAALGLQQVYLFGIDLGRKQGGSHHARNSFYHDVLKDEAETAERNFDTVLPGNFGGEVVTKWPLHMAARALGHFRKLAPMELFNCSDGLMIQGAVPKEPAALAFDGPLPDRGRILAGIEAQLRTFAAGDYLRHVDLDGAIAVSAAFHEAIAALAPARDFRSLYRRVQAVLAEPGLADASAIVGGSVMAYLRAATYHAIRLRQPAARRRFMAATVTGLASFCGELADETRALLALCRDHIEQQPAQRESGQDEAAPLPSSG